MSDPGRPRTRLECLDGPRPCPWVGCRHHLYLNVTARGELHVEFPGREPWELKQTCSLDVADDGPQTLSDVGDLMNVSRERIRQIQATVQRRLLPMVSNTRRYDLVLWRDELREVARGHVDDDDDE